jgi:Cyclic nucleotide-binding domain
MAEDKHQVISLLQKIKLFDGLDSTQLEQVAAYAQPVTLREGEALRLEGKIPPFFIMVSGEARYTHPMRRDQSQNYILRQGDYFGGDMVFHGKPKLFTLVALSPVLLFSIPIDGLRLLLNTIPELTSNVKKQLAWYNLIHSKPFNWLNEEEIVKVICRKHPAYLFLVELVPLVVAWIGVILILVAARLDTASFRLALGWFGAGVVAFAAGWAVYRYFDWGNDYYIITDQRIVWLERTIGIYDSRQEAPLVAIKSGETKSSFIGRSLGFGDVITQTFVGQVLFRHIANPGEIKNLIDQEHKIAIDHQTSSDIHTIEGKIRQKIEPSAAVTVSMRTKASTIRPTTPLISPQETRLTPENMSFGQSLLARFRTRWESGGMITYRKHLYVLFRMTWFPAACFMGPLAGSGALYYWRIHDTIKLLTPGLILLGGIALAVMGGLWWLYKFLDWSNDIYRLTPDKIIDSERKPLGDEITKSAPLENIIGLDYERLGLLGVVLNFGNVIINVGTENKFIFYGIHNPARAQRDIFNYMNAHRTKKQQADTAQEQERVSNYIAAYHRQAEDLRQSRKPPQF